MGARHKHKVIPVWGKNDWWHIPRYGLEVTKHLDIYEEKEKERERRKTQKEKKDKEKKREY